MFRSNTDWNKTKHLLANGADTQIVTHWNDDLIPGRGPNGGNALDYAKAIKSKEERDHWRGLFLSPPKDYDRLVLLVSLYSEVVRFLIFGFLPIVHSKIISWESSLPT
jgi:hypothetical protein